MRQLFELKWEAHEYEHRARSSDWFWAVGIVTVAIAIASVILSNIIFAILILDAVFALLLFINRPPELMQIIINEKGIKKDNVFYPYASLHSFWIEDHPTHPKLLLRSQKIFMPLIVLPLGSFDPERVRRTLIRFIPEHFHSTPMTERLLEYFGF